MVRGDKYHDSLSGQGQEQSTGVNSYHPKLGLIQIIQFLQQILNTWTIVILDFICSLYGLNYTLLRIIIYGPDIEVLHNISYGPVNWLENVSSERTWRRKSPQSKLNHQTVNSEIEYLFLKRKPKKNYSG